MTEEQIREALLKLTGVVVYLKVTSGWFTCQMWTKLRYDGNDFFSQISGLDEYRFHVSDVVLVEDNKIYIQPAAR